VVVRNELLVVLLPAAPPLKPMNPAGFEVVNSRLNEVLGNPADSEVDKLSPSVVLGVLAETDGPLTGNDGVLTLVLGPLIKPCVPLSPAPSVADSPRPRVSDNPALMPEDPALMPTPSEAAAESEAAAVTEACTLRMVLDEGPLTPTPALTPALGLAVTPTATQPLIGSPPLAQVVIEILFVGAPDAPDTSEDTPPTPTDTETMGVIVGDEVRPLVADVDT
jgi:hypothetical protein